MYRTSFRGSAGVVAHHFAYRVIATRARISKTRGRLVRDPKRSDGSRRIAEDRATHRVGTRPFEIASQRPQRGRRGRTKITREHATSAFCAVII